MDIMQKPISLGGLRSISRFKEGTNPPWLLEDANGKFLVKVLTPRPIDNPAEILRGTYFVEKAGVETPRTRMAEEKDREVLKRAAEKLGPVRESFLRDLDGSRYALLMEFVEGDSLKDLHLKKRKEFLDVIRHPEFQLALGRVLAADAFGGNPDRAHAYLTPAGKKVFFNTGNVMVRPSGPNRATTMLVAIDNRSHLQVDDADVRGMPWGGAGAAPSIAATRDEYAREEAALIFDHLLSQAEQLHKSEEALEEINAAKANREEFIGNVAHGMTSTMKALLTGGQKWKQQLRSENLLRENLLPHPDEGDTHEDNDPFDEIANYFRTRKRLLRQVAAGVDPQEAFSRSELGEDAKYKEWKKGQVHERWLAKRKEGREQGKWLEMREESRLKATKGEMLAKREEQRPSAPNIGRWVARQRAAERIVRLVLAPTRPPASVEK